MDNNSQAALPPGFISLDEAVKLIESDTRSDAKVDTQYLVSHLKWIEEDHNFRIPLLRNATKEEIEAMMKNPRQRPRSTISAGSVNVYIERPYHAEMLKEVIRKHYREMAGKEYESPTVRSVSSVADEEKTGGAVNPRSDKTIAKEGDTIGTGESMTTNGATL